MNLEAQTLLMVVTIERAHCDCEKFAYMIGFGQRCVESIANVITSKTLYQYVLLHPIILICVNPHLDLV